MRRGQIIRISVAMVVVLVATWLLWPRVFSELRSNGIINAKIVTISAPISGTIVQNIPDVGTRVTRGQTLTRIIDEFQPRTLLSNLDSERELLASRVKALTRKSEELKKLKERLTRQVKSHQSDMKGRLHYQFLEAEARMYFWMAAARERSLAYNRSKKLHARGYTTTLALERAESLLEQSKQEVVRAKADSARIKKEAEAADRGVFVTDGRNDVSYSQQRLDEIVISLTDLNVQQSEALGRLQAVERQFKLESQRVTQRESVIVRSPISGPVWRRFADSETYTAKNNALLKILDCSRLFVEVPVPESAADRLDAGSTVSLRLVGSTRQYVGKVSEIRGSRSVIQRDEFVAAPPTLRKNESKLIVEVTESDFDNRRAAYCQVGRRAEVMLPTNFLPAAWDRIISAAE